MSMPHSCLITLHIENLSFEAIIGILESEKSVPQPLLVNANITYLYSPHKAEKYIDYAQVSDMICQNLQTQHYELLESALYHLSLTLKSAFPSMTHLEICIKKPQILSPSIVGASIIQHWEIQ